MNAQEIFDTVTRHLAKQGKPALEDGRCRYRTKDGLSCGAGCLFTDAEYKPEMDARHERGNLVARLAERDLLPKRLLPFLRSGLLGALQTAHDNAGLRPGSVWSRVVPEYLHDVANNFGLSPAVIDECFGSVS
jgi:hypothetical protein